MNDAGELGITIKAMPNNTVQLGALRERDFQMPWLLEPATIKQAA